MAYQAGDTILDNEYNDFVTSSSDPFGINHIAGTGTAQYGLGESAVATVSAGGAITAANTENHMRDDEEFYRRFAPLLDEGQGYSRALHPGYDRWHL